MNALGQLPPSRCDDFSKFASADLAEQMLFMAPTALWGRLQERLKSTDFVEKPLNRPLVEKWFRRCGSLV
jgi:hypothetical protein